MAGGNKTLTFLFLLALALLFFPGAEAIEADELKAHYAVTLIELAENQDYAIECGPADVLTNPKLLPNIAGYPTNPAVCSMSLTDSDAKATLFSLNAEEAQSTVIEHLKDYYQPDIDNNNHIREEDLDVSACEDAEELDNNWWKCDGAVEGHSVQLYYRLGQPVTYLVTYSFSPSFDQSTWGNIIDFFRGLFGFDAEPALGQDVDAFTRGYFTKEASDGTREIQGFYHAENANANGDATILFKNFGFDIRELANGEYQLGVNNTQVLNFENLAPTEWKKITAKLRVHANGAEPLPGAVCDDGTLDFGEECEPEGDGLTCEDLGFSYGEVTCSATCQADTSGCFNCEDADGDGYYSEEGLPNELRAVNNNIQYAAMSGLEEDTAVLAPLPTSNFDLSSILSQARAHVSTFETCLETQSEYDCYQEIPTPSTATLTDGITQDFSSEQTSCEYGDQCDLTTQSFGETANNYAGLLSRDALLLIDAKELATANFGAPPTNQNYEARLELAFTCAALAQATNTNNFIYYDKGQSKTQYDRGYQACRSGLNSVGASLYYAQEPHEGIAEPGLLDGVATTNPNKYVGEETIPGTELSYKNLLLQNNAKLISITDNILESIQAGAKYHIDTTTSLGNTELLSTLEQTYTSRTDEGAATTIIVNTQEGDDFVYISQDTPGLSQDFDYSSCSGTLNEVTQEGIVASSEDLTSLPAGTYQYQTDWNCFLEDTGVSACTEDAQALDCDDGNSTVNPGEEEICGDGIDNDCNGLIDDADTSCEEDGGSTGEACNFDGYCNPDVEDLNTCADCQNACPSERVLMHKQGAYEFYAYITGNGQGQIQIESDGSSYTHACDWDGDNNQWYDMFHTQDTWTIDFNPHSQEDIQIFDNPASGGTYNAQVYLRPKDGGYQLRFEAQNSDPSQSCWDASSASANEFLGPVMNPYDHVSCNYSECTNSQVDCAGQNNYCVHVTEQIRKCKILDIGDVTCPYEPPTSPTEPEVIYLCP